MLHILVAVNDRIYAVLKVFVMVLLSAMSSIIFAQVIFRYVIKHPLSWSEEFTIYLFTWCSFLSAAMIVRNNMHIRVIAFVSYIKDARIRKAVNIFADVMMLVFCVMMAVISSNLVARMISIGQISPSMEWLNIGCVFIVVPVSMAIMALFKIELTIKSLRGEETEGGAH